MGSTEAGQLQSFCLLFSNALLREASTEAAAGHKTVQFADMVFVPPPRISARACGLCGRAAISLRERREIADIAGGKLGMAVFPDHTVDIDVPDHRGAAAQFVDDFFAGLSHRQKNIRTP
jgi:hypothetical protein